MCKGVKGGKGVKRHRGREGSNALKGGRGFYFFFF
jgi:hypothetical protein